MERVGKERRGVDGIGVERKGKMKKLIFVDCEATGPCPYPEKGWVLTEFGAVDYCTRRTFHGVLFGASPLPENPAVSKLIGEEFDAVEVFTKFEAWLSEFGRGRPIFVSDNPAFDFQWINYGFWHALNRNPFGHSGRRISDFYAGLKDDFFRTQEWKALRITPHDHNPVHDAMGNVEAFEKLLKLSKKMNVSAEEF